MSRTSPTPQEEMSLQVICDSCQADVDVWCLKAGGIYASELHAPRRAALLALATAEGEHRAVEAIKGGWANRLVEEHYCHLEGASEK